MEADVILDVKVIEIIVLICYNLYNWDSLKNPIKGVKARAKHATEAE